jgi:twitching motility protein PilT
MASSFDSDERFFQLLHRAVEAGASDIHLKVGQPPAVRIRGDVVYFKTDRLTPEDTFAIAHHIAGERQQLERIAEWDTSYLLPTGQRFRTNIYRQRATLAIVMRIIPSKIPTFEDLGLLPVYRTLAEKERGIVLVVGASGNGKSTSLASMIADLNARKPLHIVTIEDPIEYIHEDNYSSISQREIGTDTQTFGGALRAALRQDPDVIMVGEIRDEDTMDTALKAAETGHLVLSTLHTPDVARTVGRILALSPSADINELRDRISQNLQGIIAQRLLPKKDNSGVVLAAEILVASGTVRESIRRPDGNPTLKELMERGASPYGMQTFEMHVRGMLQAGLVDRETAKNALAI